MDPELLNHMLSFNTRVIGVNLEAITHDQALAQPPGGGNCVNWMLGHLVVHRNHMLRALGAEPVWNAEQDARYDRGSDPVTGDDGAATLDALRDGMERGRAALADAFAAATPGQLAAAAGTVTLGQRLALMLGHELYHAGQISVVRRYLGHGGAIR